jgi:hypothetical protein
MKCIIAGSRTISDYSIIKQAIIASGWQSDITEVVCGDAKGADYLGEQWAKAHNIPVKHFPAKWNDISAKDAIVAENSYGKYDKRAGFRRNEEMGNYTDALIAIIANNSSGTSHMIEYMQKLGKKVYIWEV